MDKGREYYTFWQDGLHGPFTYDGQSTLIDHRVFTQSKHNLEQMNYGYHLMLDDMYDEYGNFIGKYSDALDYKKIELKIKQIKKDIHALNVLKDYRKLLFKALELDKLDQQPDKE